MPWSLHRFHETGDPHFITFSCYRRQPLLRDPHACHVFEAALEQVRRSYGIRVFGYVIMPEHVHLLVTEPERSTLAVAMQMLKQKTGQKVASPEGTPFWQRRYYDRNIHSYKEHIAALRYIHRNPVKRGLVELPEQWRWSSFLHYATGAEGVVEIESEWTVRKREQMGVVPTVKYKLPHPLAKNAREG